MRRAEKNTNKKNTGHEIEIIFRNTKFYNSINSHTANNDH